MALTTNALTTVATMETELGLTAASKTALLERLIAVASDAIEQFCNRKLYYTAAIAESVPGYGGNLLHLSRTPLVSIASIVIQGTTIDSDDYEIKNAAAGSVYKESGWDWTAPYAAGLASPARVPGSEALLYDATYAGGWVTPGQVGTRSLPYDLEQACIDTVVHLYRFRGRYINAKVEKEETSKASWEGGLIPKPAQAILKKYRRVA